MRAGEATEDEVSRFRASHEEQAIRVLDLDPEQLFTVEEVHAEPPRKARIHASVTCERCGEAALETRVRRFGGQQLCQPCFGTASTGT